ncbi:MAG: 30S ribosomal protein S20, partial [Chloroflexota bacterium]|nr:30S ribosomal protein S20 [Chloroflexota bacterium]
MANTRQAIKRVRQTLRRRAVNKRTRSAAKSLVQRASRIALGQTEGDGPSAVVSAVRALDKAAAKGIIHPNNAARRKRRLMAKANAAHLLDDQAAVAAPTAARARTAASKTATRKKVAAAKASKAAAGRAADRPRTAAGKAKVAVTRASRESRAGTRRTRKPDEGE